jgi:AcrR family transcriptional regulator
MGTRTYGGQTAERRREQRRIELLDAALEIIGERGFPALTVAGLCARAGLNERYYYESFKDREAVLAAVAGRVTDEVVAAMGAAASAVAPPRTPRAIAGAALRAAVELVTDDPRKARVLFLEAPLSPELAGRRRETVRPFVRLMLEQTDAGRELGTERAEFLGTFLVGGVAETVTAWLRADRPTPRDTLIEQLTDLFTLVADGARRDSAAAALPRRERAGA